MTKASVRNAANTAWEPISFDSGAIPDRVKGLTTGLVFKSICGVSSPPATPRYIRDVTNSVWLPLDEVITAVAPVSIGFANNTRNSNSARIYPAAGAQVGDLIVAGVALRTVNPCTWTPSGDMQLLWNYNSNNLNSQPAIAAVVHTGATYYSLGCNNFGNLTTFAQTIRGQGDINNIVVGQQDFSFASTRLVRSQNAPVKSLVLGIVIDSDISGAPYSDLSGNLTVAGEFNAPSSNTDMMIANYVSDSGGATGDSTFNALASSWYASQSIGVPPA